MNKDYTKPPGSNVFNKIAYTDLDLSRKEYEDCQFIGGDFRNSKLDGLLFRDCVFESCDMSLASTKETSLQEVKFVNCKLLGVQFAECRKLMLRMAFDKCVIRLSSFNGMSLKQTRFEGCDLEEADFTGADLTGASFGRSNLYRATFLRTNLEKADFRSAYGYAFVPESNRLTKARFSMPEVLALFDTYGIEIE